MCSPKQQYECVRERNDTGFQQCRDRCLPKCRSTQFTASLSYGELQEKAENTAVVSISFPGMQITTFDDVDTVTGARVIANVGGAMGVFFGASLITVIEIVFFCLAATRRRRKRESQISV